MASRVRNLLVFIFIAIVVAATVESQTLPADSPSGFFPSTISIIAGGGALSLGPGGSLATSTGLQGIVSVAVDSQKNVYISESGSIAVVYAGLGVPPILYEITTQPAVGNVYEVTNPDPSTACIPPLTGCGDGGPASGASFNSISNLFIDASDNVYVTDGGASVVREIVQNKQNNTTTVMTVAGQINNPGTPSNGMPAAQNATLSYPADAKVDAAGNLYIADEGNNVVDVVYLNDPAPPILATEKLSPAKGAIYTVAGTLGQFCTAPGQCGENGSATSAMFFLLSSVDVDNSGNIYATDFGANFEGSPIITGTARLIYAGGSPPPLLNTVISQPAPGTMYTIAGKEEVYNYPATGNAACSTASCGDGGPALQAEINGANYVRVDSSGSNVYIDDKNNNTIRKVDTAGYISAIAGMEAPGAPTVPSAGSPPPGSGGPATQAGFNNPVNFAFDSFAYTPQNHLYVADYDVIWDVAPALPQTITFNQLQGPVTYGTAPIQLTATASSGLPVSYTVTGPATVNTTATGASYLVINGAGTVQITASQAGNSQYAQAQPVTQSLTVDPALLTVTALSTSITTQATHFPTFQAVFTGFVNGDTQQTAVSGTPAFSTTAKLGQCSNNNVYPITVSEGTLTAANYTLAFVSGTLTITGTQTQSVTFSPPGSVTYGQTSTIALKAQATAGPVEFTVISGPGTVSGSTLQITGGGAIVIQAYQPGNCTYQSATSTQTLTVNPAPLTVTGPNVTLPYGTTVDPTQFPKPTITGFVGTDSQAGVSGIAAYSTVSGTPQPGSYPIQVSQGTLALAAGYASNYTFADFVSGTLTVTAASQTINFTALPALTTYLGNSASINLIASASSGLPVTFTTTGPVQFFNGVNTTNPSAGQSSVSLYETGIGAVTVTATQVGNTVYAAAPPVTQTFTVLPAVLTITATSLTRTYGTPNPQLVYTFGMFAGSDSDIPSVITGVPTLSTTATQQSPAGTYPIVITQGTLAAPNYTFNLVNGTLTILPAGNYTLTASPPTLTIQSGHSAQTTITLTPNNDYQGTITLSCGSLPANVTCIFSPATYTFNGNANGATEPVLQGTLTVNTLGGQTVVGKSLPPYPPFGGPIPALAIPVSLAGLLITFGRKRSKRIRPWYLVALAALSLGSLALTSCGSASAPALAATGTTTITVNGVDAQGVSTSMPLTVTIQ